MMTFGTEENVTGRDGYLIRQALAIAIETLSVRPDQHRPESNIADMRELLTAIAGADGAAWHLGRELALAKTRRADVTVISTTGHGVPA